ncbi:element excision factor XisI family protein [Anabaena cylindrica UHCC 0172]|uniref:element excision factor XisI family protein n=1 Tax=Anabaena cylindrica TaxID=1165 RepID=UPI002B1F9652|nr:element excision factor XisI family protein [Anabaena cylindrica]MEA5549412.1 element excision factor XisI family protein [Anabaena cylindrica UHCC 0172]
MYKKQIQHLIIYITIGNGKTCVEEDAINLCLVADLLSVGIPRNDIILSFHHPMNNAGIQMAVKTFYR